MSCSVNIRGTALLSVGSFFVFPCQLTSDQHVYSSGHLTPRALCVLGQGLVGGATVLLRGGSRFIRISGMMRRVANLKRQQADHRSRWQAGWSALRAVEPLEPRWLLAAVPFAEQPVLVGLEEARDVLAADIDGDGDFDVVSTSGGGAAWMENTDGLGRLGQPRLVANPVGISARSIAASDLDGDGDVDLIVGSASGDTVAWYENVDGKGEFGRSRSLWRSGQAQLVSSVDVADLDGYGDVDVLAASQYINGVLWFENGDAEGAFSDPASLGAGQIQGARAVKAADLDGDGDLDVLGAASTLSSDSVFWIENRSGAQAFGSVQTRPAPIDVRFVNTSDLDGDGDLDVLVASGYGDTVAWYENVDGGGRLGPLIRIDSLFYGNDQLLGTDLDGDGDNDVVATSALEGTVVWYANTDGRGHFAELKVVAELFAEGLDAADIDADGDVDLVAVDTSAAQIALLRNAGGGSGFAQTLVPPHAQFVRTADIDGDGDLDIAALGSRTLWWLENADGEGSFERSISIADGLSASVVGAGVADMDGDGDLDVVIAQSTGPAIVWFENSDGKGTFRDRHESAAKNREPWRLVLADIDRDGDTDVLTSSNVSASTVWFENVDGKGLLQERELSFREQGALAEVALADVDGDGDLDVFSAEYSKLSWHENFNGQGAFDEFWILDENFPFAEDLKAADIDGDGDPDVVVAISDAPGRLGWFQNTDGKGTFSAAKVFGSFDGSIRLDVVDVDGDGDADILTADRYTSLIRWYENSDGAGTFQAPHSVSAETAGVADVEPADIDADGNLDIVAAASEGNVISWFRNVADERKADVNQDGRVDAADIDQVCRAARAGQQDSTLDLDGDGAVQVADVLWLVRNVLDTNEGDANLDGRFDELDLIQVLEANQFQDDVAGNSGWATGDWNCDGEFDRLDVIAALASGRYVGKRETA